MKFNINMIHHAGLITAQLDDVISQYERLGLTFTPRCSSNRRDIDGDYCKYPTTRRVVSSVSVLSAFSESISERCKTAV